MFIHVYITYKSVHLDFTHQAPSHPLRLSGMQGISDEVRDSVAKADFLFRP